MTEQIQFELVSPERLLLSRPVDMVGFFLAGIAFAGCVFGLSVVSLPALPIIYGYLTIAVGVTAGILYLLHARRTKFPLLDPALLRHRLFRSSITGGSFFRIGVGAVPFLLPLMLQPKQPQLQLLRQLHSLHSLPNTPTK